MADLKQSVVCSAMILVAYLSCNYAGDNNGTAGAGESWESAIEDEELREYAVSEPSGLSEIALDGTFLRAIFVDDEIPGIFVLEYDTASTERTIYGPLRFPGFKGKDPDDLEGACKRENEYFVITSHRRIAKKGRFDEERRFLKFGLEKAPETGYRIVNAEAKEIAGELVQFLRENGIRLDEKSLSRQGSLPYPYAMEIEGLASDGALIFMGLKMPLAEKQQAILLTYNWDEKRFEGFFKLDLAGKGISSLDCDTENNILYVAANPPGKGDDDLFTGESAVYAFRVLPGRLPEQIVLYSDYRRKGAKLEGVAVHGNAIWLLYDGSSPLISFGRATGAPTQIPE